MKLASLYLTFASLTLQVGLPTAGNAAPLVSPAILLANDGASADHFGASIAADGNIAVVGAPGHAGSQGAAYVFVRSGTIWTQQAQLTASDGAKGDQFGTSVAMSGSTILVGAGYKASSQGAAYVFVQSGAAWSQQAELTLPDGAAGDYFGFSVSLSGTTAVVGASNKTSGQGKAYVYVGQGGVWSQQATLTSADGAAGDQFGYSVAVNADTAVIGAYAKASGQGAAYVFVRSAGAWSQQTKLAAISLASDAQFGASVAVNADTAVIGTSSKSITATGIAYVFVRTGTIWSQQAALTSPSDSDPNGFGLTVAVNGDTILCGEPFNLQIVGEAHLFVRSGSTWTPLPKLTASDGAIGDEFSLAIALTADTALAATSLKTGSQGAAYAYARTGSTWTQQAIFSAAGGSSADSFGNSVSVSGDTVLVGAGNKAANRGGVYVFTRSGANWPQQAKLISSDNATGDFFGSSVSVDGDTAVIGASGKGGQGAAYVFVRSGGAWTQQAKLTIGDAANGDNFGISVSVKGDTAVVGANGRTSAQGVAYVFVRSGGTWTQQAKLAESDPTSTDFFGSSVALSGDTVLIGARFKNSGQGAAYIFVRSGTTWTQQSKILASDGASSDNFGLGCSLDGDTAIVGAYNKAINGGAAGQGAVYVFARSGTTWSQQAKLTASDGAGRDIFGLSTSLSGDTVVIGASNHAGRGTAYLFARSGATWTQQLELTAPDGAAGDSFAAAVSLNQGTVVAGASAKFSQLGEAYVFPFPAISTGGVVNGASFVAPVAPGSLATAFGNNFSTVDTSASDVPLPTSLNNVSVSVNGKPAPLIFVGYQQVNFQVPYETTPGSATVVVTVNGVASSTATVAVNATAPGVLVYGANRAIVQNDDFSLNDPTHPAKVGSYIVIYAVGLGQLDNAVPTGARASANPLSNAVVTPTVTIGGVNGTVIFAGMTPGFVGLAQLDVQIPALSTGTYPVVIKQGSQTSNNPVINVTQ